MKTTRNDSLKLIFSIALALAFTAYLSSVHAGDIAASISKVNGSIEVPEASVAANVKTVNGTIRIQQRAVAADVSTVNGGVHLNDNSEVRSAETVNGAIRVGEEVVVDHSLGTVNGSIRVNRGTSVGEQIQTVNGAIQMDGASVEGDVRTVNGDIRIRNGSIVNGDIIVDKPRKSFWSRFSFGGSREPVVEIGRDVEINGTIYLYREVKLEIDHSATVGDIVHDY